ncbi:Uncharacterised protein [Mycobacteroides abscessus subsp. abscessus]|nr:Uncharacterised protein [Mycobacteroides abscessus subsp. abscessus]
MRSSHSVTSWFHNDLSVTASRARMASWTGVKLTSSSASAQASATSWKICGNSPIARAWCVTPSISITVLPAAGVSGLGNGLAVRPSMST